MNWQWLLTTWYSKPGALTAAVATLGLFIVQVIAKHRKERARNPRRLPLPPGPKGLPLLGNLFQIPTVEPWAVYNEWAKVFGNVVYVNALGQDMVILNSLEDVDELLEKRAANNSDRTRFVLFELMELDWIFAVMRYGPRWRAHRRAFHQQVNLGQLPGFHPIIEEEMVIYLKRLLEKPEEFLEETKSVFGHIIIRISYGSTDPEYNKELLQISSEVAKRVSESITQGKYLVNVFPSLEYIPSWFPGAGWKRYMLAGAVPSRRLLTEPFDDAKARYKNRERGLGGSEPEYPSISRGLIEKLPAENDPNYLEVEGVAKAIAAIAYLGGSDTTVNSAQALVLALGANPDVQRKAQQQLDRLIDTTSRLPSIDDKNELPYIQAIIKELGRWYNVLPLSTPHFSMEDAEYKGYFIPKGTMFLPNTWAIMHDPALFSEPLEFRPERYLKDGNLDPSVLGPESAAFGYGRRICPGQNLSNDSLFEMAACLLATFDILPPSNADAKQLKLEVESELTAKVKPYQCQIVPRSRKHADLIRSL